MKIFPQNYMLIYKHVFYIIIILFTIRCCDYWRNCIFIYLFIFYLRRKEGRFWTSLFPPVISSNVVILGVPFFLSSGSIWNIASSNERWRSSCLGVRWRAAGKQAAHLQNLSKDSTEPCWINYSQHVQLIQPVNQQIFWGTRWFCDR